jgi:hypothetical protein
MALKVVPTQRIYPNVGDVRDHYVILYGDQVVGSLYRINGGPQDNLGRWSLFDVGPQPTWRYGVAYGYEGAKRTIGERFRRWMDEGGPRPKP